MRFASTRLVALCFVLIAAGSTSGFGQSTGKGPANATILIIRHAEKPESGVGLSDAGQKRANAYPEFFHQFQIDTQPAHLDFLIATRDSDNSQRPRLTLQPLSAALHLPIEANIKNKDFGTLIEQLKEAKFRGKTTLIAWHHGNSANILLALGADPAHLLPGGRWPDEVFGWLVQLRYDGAGQLKESIVINEKLMPADSDLPPPAAH